MKKFTNEEKGMIAYLCIPLIIEIIILLIQIASIIASIITENLIKLIN